MKKTNVMCIRRKGNNKLKIYVDGQVEQVSQFRYLGSLISEDGYCMKEIQSRMKMAKKVFMENKKLFTGKMNLELKKNNEMLGLECSTVCSRDVDIDTDRIRLEAFEMLIWRIMEKISWLDKVTNEEVLKTVNEDRQILNCIWQRKHQWIGQVLRQGGLLHEIIEGRMKGKPTKGEEEFKCCKIWQIMVALLHSNGQLRT